MKNTLRSKVRISQETKETLVYIGVMLGTFAALLLIVLFTFGSFYKNAKEDIIIKGMNEVSDRAMGIESKLDMATCTLNITESTIEYLLEQGAELEEIDSYLKIQSRGIIDSSGEELSPIVAYIDDTFLFGAFRDDIENYDATTYSWYKDAVDNAEEICISAIYTDAFTGRKIVTLSKSLKNKKGVIAMDLYMENIQRMTEETKLNGYGSGVLFDNDGYILASKNTDAIGTNNFNSSDESGDIVSREIVESDDEFILSQNINGTDYMTFSKKIGTSWNFVLIVESDKLYHDARVLLGRNTVLSFVIFLLVGYFSSSSLKGRRQETNLRKKQERLTEELQIALNEANAANAAKSRFMFNMSHDIRTPMNAIMGFTDAAIRNIDNKNKVSDSLSKVKVSGEHLLKLINDVLDMARIESNKVEIECVPCSVFEGVNMIVPIITNLAEQKGVNFQYELVNIRDPYIYYDYLHIHQVMINFLSNAIKFTKPGGHVLYSVEQLESTRPGYTLYKNVIKDDGIGMSPEFLEHIYDRFSRERSSTASGVEGTGLGMAIAKNLIDLMGGTVNIESEQGVGTTVTVIHELKIVEKGQLKEVEDEDGNGIADFVKGKRILIVEDNELNREIVRDILAEQGAIIDEAEDGTVAVDRVREVGQDYYDAVLMDIQMPYMDGFTATKLIREYAGNTKLPIIALTANAFDEDRKKAIECGMSDHLGKPIDVMKLISALKKNIKEKEE